jgi:hypothetical protein
VLDEEEEEEEVVVLFAVLFVEGVKRSMCTAADVVRAMWVEKDFWSVGWIDDDIGRLLFCNKDTNMFDF